MATIHYRVTFGTESSDFRSQGSPHRNLVGEVSRTNQPGNIVIETLTGVGHLDGRRRRSVAGRWRALEVVERTGEGVAHESQKMGMMEESETRALVLCWPATRFVLSGPLQKPNRRSLRRLQ